MKLCKSPYPPLHCHNASKVGREMKADDMSSLINLKMGLVICVLLLQRERETETEWENETGTSYWFTGNYPTIQKDHLSLAFTGFQVPKAAGWHINRTCNDWGSHERDLPRRVE